jgi:2-C-methyl-D-erythritol 4-phosphate cytidylyltransferase
VRCEVAVIVAAAGAGERLGAGVPKALALAAGEPLVVHSIRRLVRDSRVGLIVLALPAGLVPGTSGPDDWVESLGAQIVAAAGRVPVTFVAGGATRAASVAAALRQVPQDVPTVLTHDAARCLVPATVISRVIDAVIGGAVAVVPSVPVVDTVRSILPTGNIQLDRRSLAAVQTPQGFSTEVLRRAHAVGDLEATDDAGMVEALGLEVTLVGGHVLGFKVTTPLDLMLAEAILGSGSEPV